MGGVISILCTILGKLIAEEAKDWLPIIALNISHFAVRILPIDQRERYDEEWCGHLAEVPGRLAKLFVSLGFVIAAFRIARLGQQLHARVLALLLLMLLLPGALGLIVGYLFCGVGVRISRQKFKFADGTTGILSTFSPSMSAGKWYSLDFYLRVYNKRLRRGHYLTWMRPSTVVRLARFGYLTGLHELPTLFYVAIGQTSVAAYLRWVSKEGRGVPIFQGFPLPFKQG